VRLSQIKLFRWRAYGVAINATSWIIEYYDPLVRAQNGQHQAHLWAGTEGIRIGFGLGGEWKG